MFKSLPIELYYKILTYGVIEPLHLVAYKTAKIRPIFGCELNCNLIDNVPIKLNDDLFRGEDLTTLTGIDAEYYMFLLNQ